MASAHGDGGSAGTVPGPGHFAQHVSAGTIRPGPGALGQRGDDRTDLRATGGWVCDRPVRVARGLLYVPGALALIGIFFFVPKAQSEERRDLNWFGLATLIFAFAWLQYALSRGAREDWFESTQIVVAMLIAGFSAYLFVVHTLTTKKPLVSAAMFRNRNFVLGATGGFIFGASATPLSLLLALMLQNQLDYPVELIGLILVRRAIGILISQYAVAFLIVHVDPRRLMVGGVFTCSYATWVMSGWSLDVSPWQVAWTILLHGIGDGFIWMSLNPLAFSMLDARHRAQAVPLYYLSVNVGLSLGIAGIMTYWAHSSQVNHALLAEFITPFNELIRGDRLPSDVAAATIAGEISRQAAMIAYNNCFIVMTVGILFVVPVAYFIRNPGWRPEYRLAWMLHEQPIVIEFSAESSMVGDGCRRLKG